LKRFGQGERFPFVITTKSKPQQADRLAPGRHPELAGGVLYVFVDGTWSYAEIAGDLLGLFVGGHACQTGPFAGGEGLDARGRHWLHLDDGQQQCVRKGMPLRLVRGISAMTLAIPPFVMGCAW
jgi:hypothetical protein